jgi:hypothetical protein
MLNKLYLTLGSILLLGYTVMAWNGWEFGDEARHVIPAEERHKPGGYRSAVFWHWGFRGGK